MFSNGVKHVGCFFYIFAMFSKFCSCSILLALRRGGEEVQKRVNKRCICFFQPFSPMLTCSIVFHSFQKISELVLLLLLRAFCVSKV